MSRNNSETSQKKWTGRCNRRATTTNNDKGRRRSHKRMFNQQMCPETGDQCTCSFHQKVQVPEIRAKRWIFPFLLRMPWRPLLPNRPTSPRPEWSPGTLNAVANWLNVGGEEGWGEMRRGEVRRGGEELRGEEILD